MSLSEIKADIFLATKTFLTWKEPNPRMGEASPGSEGPLSTAANERPLHDSMMLVGIGM